MPIYEYFCRTCNTKYEKLRPLRDADTPVSCPTCNEQNSVRALSLFISHVSNGGSTRASEQPAHHHSGRCGCGGMCGCASKN